MTELNQNLYIEITDGGSGFYIRTDPEGQWDATTQPDDLLTVDWDSQGRVIGIEVIGSAAREATQAMLRAIADYGARDPAAVTGALANLARGKEGMA